MPSAPTRRPSAHDVDRLFLDRWSARAMSGAALTNAELLTLFEAARWAPSSGNQQPWRMLYARRDSDFWPAFLDLLLPANRAWAQRAGALVVMLSRTRLDDGRACLTHSYDTGAAWENLALQASLKGLVAHGIQGFDYERARRVLRVPEEYAIEAMAVLGKPGSLDDLSESLQAREQPSDRRPLAQSICEGPFSFA